MLQNNVPFHEFHERRSQCVSQASDRGLNGLMVWSRGGGTFDRYADVDYLANHYQQRCYLPDYMPLWSGRSHCVLFIPVEGEPILVVSSPEYSIDLIAVSDVRYSNDFIGECRRAIYDLNMDEGKVGLVGADVLPFAYSQKLFAETPELEVATADDIVQHTRMIKSPREEACINEACRIGTSAVNQIMRNVSEGKTESQIIAPAIETVVEEGAVVYFVITSSGSYINYAQSVDFPGYDHQRKVENGELFRVDLIISYQGYMCDFGRSCVVGHTPSIPQQEMLDMVTDACEHVIQSIQPGLRVKDLCRIGDNYLEERGVSFAVDQTNADVIYAGYPPHWGHGLGMSWERPWLVKEEEMTLEPNMFLAIEKSLYKPGVGTVSYEQNIKVTENGACILTTSPKKWDKTAIS
ncbi:M24 family metallopeptidase [Pontibacillus yanchengensis]|nr:Xaa-Pro peptidase family protein [Pontibacillus yanchengensis]